jgi:hypothetical protein
MEPHTEVSMLRYRSFVREDGCLAVRTRSSRAGRRSAATGMLSPPDEI